MRVNFSVAIVLGVLIIAACSSTDSGDGQTVHGRLAFEELRRRDPATGLIPENIREKELLFARSLPGSLQSKNSSENVQAFGEWQSRGPWNIGGRTRAFAFDVENPLNYIAGAVSGGVWRSTDDGVSWNLTTAPDQLHSVTCIAQDIRPGHTNVWYYGTGEIYGNSSQISGNGVFRSSDNGSSWSVLPSTISNVTPASNSFAYTWRILSHARGDGAVYVASARAGIQRSVDGGATWTTALGSNALFCDVIATSNGTLYAAFSATTGSTGSVASRWGIYRSVDGVTWVNVTPTDMNKDTRRIVLAPIPQSADQMIVVAETPGTGTRGSSTRRGETIYEWHSLWKYSYLDSNGTGLGGSWENRSANIPIYPERRGSFYSQGGYDLVASVSPSDSNLVVIGGTNLYRSSDQFTSTTTTAWIGGYWKTSPYWDRYSMYANHHPDQQDAVFHPTLRDVLISVSDGGIMRTDKLRAPVVEWTDLNTGYLTTQFYTIDQEGAKGSERLIGGMQDNATWATNSVVPTKAWSRLGGGDGAYCYFADSGLTQYYSSQEGRIYRIRFAADGSEIDRSRIEPADGKNYIFINPYVLHPIDNHVMYSAGGSVLWRNNDLRTMPTGVNDSTNVNWDKLLATNLISASITAVMATTASDGGHIVYYGTSSGAVYKLTDAQTGQPTPVLITSADMPRGAYVNSISVDPTDSDYIVLCFSNYGVVSVWASRDAGGSWKPIAGNLEDQPNGSGSGPAVMWASLLPYDEDTTLCVVATSTGIYFTSRISGMSTVWTQTAPTVIGNVPCDMVIGRVSDKQFAVASHGRGTFTGTILSLPPGLSQPPTLLSPLSGKGGILSDTILTWNPLPGAVTYQVNVWVAGDPALSVTFEGLKGTSVSLLQLVQGPVTYSWNVEAFNGGGGSGPSETWTFSTAVRAPLLYLPLAGATDVVQAYLTWERVPAALTYGLEVSPNAGFNPIVLKMDGIVDTTILVRGLESNKRYFWRVRSANNDGMGFFSNRQSFVTGIVSSVDNEPPSELSIAIEPNPATDIMRVCISDALRGVSSVLRITDAQGRTVQTLKIEDCTNVSASSLASGTYTVTVLGNGRAASAQFVVKR